MNRLFAVLMFVILPASATDLVGVEMDANDWYRNSYAALWKDARSIDLDKVRSHYANGYRIHTAEGGFTAAMNSEQEWLKTLQYFGDLWLGSDLKRVSVTAFNTNSVSIHSEWVNRNSDGTTSSNCANYVAARLPNVGWQFLDLFILACPK
ncbi:MAG: hypothetical protein ACU84Q_13880 [Gammaproteobacteria bacterium]